jgi:hypothetical protein
MKFNKLVQELNLYSADPLVLTIKKVVSDKTSDQNIINWFTRKYVRWFKSGEGDDEKAVWTRPHQKQEGDPSWADSAFDFIGFDSAEEDRIGHWVDYFQSLPASDLNKIDKLTYNDVKGRVEEWDAEMGEMAGRGTAKGSVESSINKYHKNQTTNVEGTKDLKVGVDFKVFERTSNPKYVWVKHITKDSLECESDDMGHCVGRNGYNPDNIISLWDRRGNSYVTIELTSDGKSINQIKGKKNEQPHEKYIPYIKEVISNNDFVVTHDGEALGMVKYESQYYYPDSPEWEEVYQTKIIPMQQAKFDEIKSRIVYDD